MKKTVLFIFAFFFICLCTITAQETPLNEMEIEVEQMLQDPGFRSYLDAAKIAIPALADPSVFDLPAEQIIPSKPELSGLAGNLSEQIRVQLLAAVDNYRNENTIGYKQRQVEFSGDYEVKIKISERRGKLQNTDRELDIAIDGTGFFRLLDKETGAYIYTRCGEFERDRDMNIGLITGSNIRNLDPMICVAKECRSIRIDPNGDVHCRADDTEEYKLVGKITLWRFSNPARLKPLDSRCFVETELSGSPIEIMPDKQGTAKILQNRLEQSNVNVEQLRNEIERLLELRKVLQAMGDISEPCP